MKLLPFCLLSVCALTCMADTPPVLCVAEANARCESPNPNDTPFSLTGHVSARLGNGDGDIRFVLEDASGRTLLHTYLLNARDRADIQVGSRLTSNGRIYADSNGNHYLGVTSLHVEQPDAILPAAPTPTCLATIATGKFDLQTVCVTGTVTDVMADDVDAGNAFLILSSGGLSIRHPGRPENLAHLVGAEIELTGLVLRSGGWRVYIDRHIQPVDGIPPIRVLKPAPADPFSVPELGSPRQLNTQALAHLGRCRFTGRVLAAWQGNRFLLYTGPKLGETVLVTLSGDQPLPRPNAVVQVVGQPDTDFFSIIMRSARWRPAELPADRKLAPDPPKDIAAKELFSDADGQSRFSASWHGRAVRLRGVVQNVSEGVARLYVESDGQLVTVDASGCPEAVQSAAYDSTVEISGVCCLQTEAWQRDARIPRITGLSVVLRGPGDVRVLARPPWWTPARLLAALGALVALLLAIIAWNVALRRRSDRRGRELAAEQLAHVAADLKVSERTRLAVELHDALSQTLTGVSMQIDTAAGLVQDKVPGVGRCLNLASKTVDACRMELRNTLWDLRNAALDDADMNSAIRKTLCQNLADVSLCVRFDVPREAFSDNTAHAILKIVRELVSNAVRHGKAGSVRIAGAIEGGRLLFSVSDDGCGFDPDLAPGIGEGHFGLQGITERLARLNGEMKVESAPGKGTKVTASLPLHPCQA